MTIGLSIQQVSRTVQKERRWIKSLCPIEKQKQRDKIELRNKDLTQELKTTGFRTANLTKFSITYWEKERLKVRVLSGSCGHCIIVPMTHSLPCRVIMHSHPFSWNLFELPQRLNNLGHLVNLVTRLVSANAVLMPHADNSFRGSGMIWLCLLAVSLSTIMMQCPKEGLLFLTGSWYEKAHGAKPQPTAMVELLAWDSGRNKHLLL